MICVKSIDLALHLSSFSSSGAVQLENCSLISLSLIHHHFILVSLPCHSLCASKPCLHNVLVLTPQYSESFFSYPCKNLTLVIRISLWELPNYLSLYLSYLYMYRSVCLSMIYRLLPVAFEIELDITFLGQQQSRIKCS